MENNKTCEYGCGQEAKYQMTSGKWCCENNYCKCSNIKNKIRIKNLNKKFSEEARYKLSQSKIGTKQSEDTKRKRSESMLGSKNHFYGKHHSEKTKTKLSKINTGKIISDEVKNKISDTMIKRYSIKEVRDKLKGSIPWNKGKTLSCITRQKLSDKSKGKILSESHKKHIGEKIKGKKHKEETKEKIRLKNLGKIRSLETREKLRKNMIYRFKNDKNFQEKYKKGLLRKPNKPETILINLLTKIIPEKFEYVGDYSTWIDGKNPDFINKKERKIIEYFGGHWHDFEITLKSRKEHEEERICHFQKNGYKTLIIWDKEIDDIDNLIVKILEFSNG